jgi:hypothetical protein
MMPTLCRQCGGLIFHDARECENPNVCVACGDWQVEHDTASENLICLRSYFEANRNGREPQLSPEAEEAG